MGHTIRVEQRADLWDMAEAHGRWIDHKQLIEIQEATKENGMTKGFQLQTFWHEAAHAMLEHIGRKDLSEDEQFVDLLGQAIYQLLKTKRSK